MTEQSMTGSTQSMTARTQSMTLQPTRDAAAARSLAALNKIEDVEARRRAFSQHMSGSRR